MDPEILDDLENKVDEAVSSVTELRFDNEVLREEVKDLETAAGRLGRDLEKALAGQDKAGEMKARCRELEKKLSRARTRLEKTIGKLKALET